MLEILLIIAAWKRGWRWKALLPPLITYLTVLMIGGGVASSGGDPALVFVPCFIGELTVLGIMAARAPRGVSLPREARAEPGPAAIGETRPERQKT